MFGIGEEGVVPSYQHALGQILDQRLGLDVKVLDHFIGPPASKHADTNGIYVRAEKGHGP